MEPRIDYQTSLPSHARLPLGDFSVNSRNERRTQHISRPRVATLQPTRYKARPMPDTKEEGRAALTAPLEEPLATGAADRIELLTAVRAWLASNAPDLVVVFALSALCLLHRLETLEPVNVGGDAAIKWQFVREWFYAHDFGHAEWNHHMTRFGVLVPAYIAQRIMGHGLSGYYAAPLAACVVQVLSVYGCGKRLSGRFAGVLATLLLIYTGVMAIAGSQLLPDLFTGTYGIAMVYFYLRFADASGKPRVAWLVACAVTAFIGYLAKETMVFFYPGIALGIWFAARRPREFLIFCGVLLLGLLLETAAYHTFTRYSNRLTLVVTSHIGPNDDEGRADTTFWKLFDRYRHVDKPWQTAFYIFLPCWAGVVSFTRDYRVRATLGVVASFFFFLTFLVRGIHPLQLWHRFMSRYLDPTAPFVALVVALFGALIVSQLWQQRGQGIFWKQIARLQRYGVVATVLLCAGLAWWTYEDTKDGRSTFTVGTEMARVANDTYRRNLPIVIRKARGKANYARSVDGLYSVYLDVDDLLRGGRLPSFDEAKRVTGNLTYLVKTPEAYTPARVTQLLNAGCALEVREAGSFMTVSPTEDLPASCDHLPEN